jgi:hypothetical protein
VINEITFFQIPRLQLMNPTILVQTTIYFLVRCQIPGEQILGLGNSLPEMRGDITQRANRIVPHKILAATFILLSGAKHRIRETHSHKLELVAL